MHLDENHVTRNSLNIFVALILSTIPQLADAGSGAWNLSPLTAVP